MKFILADKLKMIMGEKSECSTVDSFRLCELEPLEVSNVDIC